MDVVVHAIVGLATGTLTGNPLLGAVAAVLPDLPIMGPRRAQPPTSYKLTHGLFFTTGLTLLAYLIAPQYGVTVGLSLLSHTVLDVPTHGPDWAPRLLYPYSEVRLLCFKEWEFFNCSWFLGLSFALLWSGACLVLRLQT